MRLPTRTFQVSARLNLRSPVNRGALAFGALLAVCSAPAQSPHATPAPTTLQSTTTLVFVPALVETPAKAIVYSLTAADFELTDNGIPQKISLEADEDAARPLALVVLMQIGGAAHKQFAKFAHLDTMLAGMVGTTPNKVAIVDFDSRPEYDSPFTSDVAEWSDAINHPQSGNGGAAIFDGLAYALDLLKQQPPGTRRAILLISQQHDEGSKTSVKDIIRAVGESNTAVYSLTFSTERAILKEALFDSTHLTKPLSMDQPGVDLLAPILLAQGAMRRNLAAEVAGLSGGEPFGFSNKAEFDRGLGTITNHIRNGYMLSFRPTSTQPGLHTLKLRVVDHPELRIDARTSYWAENPAAPE